MSLLSLREGSYRRAVGNRGGPPGHGGHLLPGLQELHGGQRL